LLTGVAAEVDKRMFLKMCAGQGSEGQPEGLLAFTKSINSLCDICLKECRGSVGLLLEGILET
ncbi:hypothetical protein NDU88_001027, partial [Pleurodeles waltl]